MPEAHMQPEHIEGLVRTGDLESELAACHQQLKASRHKEVLAHAFSESVVDYAFVSLDLENRVIDWNRGAERLLGYAREEAVGQSGSIFFTPEDRANGEVQRELTTARTEGRASDERWHLRKSGERFWGSGIMFPLRDGPVNLGYAKVFRDLTAAKQMQSQIESSLREKELFLREMHHRVRNNLQIVSSLIGMQARAARHADLRAVFDSLQDRVRAIASLHETLYNSPEPGAILLGPYLEHLLRDIESASAIDSSRISSEFTADDMAVEIEQALPVGLILNELITNAVKHAFPQGRHGRIEVSLRYLGVTDREGDSARCHLSVSDNGSGLAGADPNDLETTGLRLVHVLVRELHGELRITSDAGSGTRFDIYFPFERAAAG